MYYPKQKLVFVHIPKTGGSTLEYHLGQTEHPRLYQHNKGTSKAGRMQFLTKLYKMYQLEPEGKRHNIHRLASQYDDIDDWHSYNYITILRNPFSQIKSLYTMNYDQAVRSNKNYPTWEEYIFEDRKNANYLSGQKAWVDQYYITGEGSGVDEMYPFEHYQEIMCYIGEQYNFEPDFGVKLWATKPKHEYTPDMIARVMSLYGDSLHLWQDCKEWWEEHNVPYRVG